jgi:diaminohydroxyphosphoribosylaminopyrimidine deaminase/5-amino-6-(5-phosphoribosylamino)uracil reductase
MTLDGKIAPPPTDSLHRTAGIPPGGWITSEAARAHVHELRHQHDAILAGVGTILADDPLLTDRSGHPRRRPLLRVILDSRLRLPVESRLVQSLKDGHTTRSDVLVFCTSNDETKKADFKQHGVRVEQLPAAAPDGRPDLHAVLRRLGQLEITNVLIEGGATVNGAVLAAGIVDKVFLYYAPKILGGTGSVPFSIGGGFRDLNEAAQVKSLQLHRFGEEFAVEGYLRDPYGE